MRRLLGLLSLIVLLPHSAWAAVAFGTIGTVSANGSTSINVPHPASIAAGDLLFLCIANKYPTNAPSTPAGGWAMPTDGQGSGGSGVAGADSGDVYATVFVKVADGSESGNLAVTITGANVSYGVMARYTNATGAWSYAATNGSDTSADTSWSVTGAADPGVTAGDMVLTCSGGHTDAALESSHVITQTGITYGSANERFGNGTSFVDDIRAFTSDHAVSSGTSSAAPVYTATLNSAQAGASVILRIREVAAGGVTPKGTLLGVYP